jgi:RHS repeat-associated protein
MSGHGCFHVMAQPELGDLFPWEKSASWHNCASGRQMQRQKGIRQVQAVPGVYYTNPTAVGLNGPTRTKMYLAGHVVGQWSDRLGSTRYTPSGSTYAHYYPYGEEITSTNNDTYKYARLYRDSDSGLDYARNRFYSSAIGRFLTPDKKRRSAHLRRPQTMNRYSYVLNSPVNFKDPRGTEAECDPGDDGCDVACDDDDDPDTCQDNSGGNGGGGDDSGDDGDDDEAEQQPISPQQMQQYQQTVLNAQQQAYLLLFSNPACSAGLFSGPSDATGWADLLLNTNIGLADLGGIQYGNGTATITQAGTNPANGDIAINDNQQINNSSTSTAGFFTSDFGVSGGSTVNGTYFSVSGVNAQVLVILHEFEHSVNVLFGSGTAPNSHGGNNSPSAIDADNLNIVKSCGLS